MKIGVIYESTRGRTKAMAEAICEGAASVGVECEVIDAREFNGLEGICALAIGSSTRMKKVLPVVKRILSELPDLEGLPAAGFGSYGWSGEAPGRIFDTMENIFRMNMVDGGPLMLKSSSLGGGIPMAQEYGKEVAKKLEK